MGEVLKKNTCKLGGLFGVNPQLLDGIIGILNGDYEALALMAAPIANIDPKIVTRIVGVLNEVKNFLTDFNKRSNALTQNRGKKGDLR